MTRLQIIPFPAKGLVDSGYMLIYLFLNLSKTLQIIKVKYNII